MLCTQVLLAHNKFLAIFTCHFEFCYEIFKLRDVYRQNFFSHKLLLCSVISYQLSVIKSLPEKIQTGFVEQILSFGGIVSGALLFSRSYLVAERKLLTCCHFDA